MKVLTIKIKRVKVQCGTMETFVICFNSIYIQSELT